MSRTQRNFLRALRDAVDRGVRASAVPSSCQNVVSALETCGAVVRQRAGRGEILVIRDRGAFDLYLHSHFPLGVDEVAEPQDRIDGVRLYGNAKTASRGRCEGVFMRSHKPDTAMVASDGHSLPVGKLTAVAGVAAATLDEVRRWRFVGTVAVIENTEPFWHYERELPDVDLAIYAAGRLSERVLAWLGSDDMAGACLVHWGDYDPVGCLEFLRLRERCGERAGMYLPTRIDELLPIYGKASLIDDQIQVLAVLRQLDLPNDVRSLLNLFDRHRRGLEQEALLV